MTYTRLFVLDRFRKMWCHSKELRKADFCSEKLEYTNDSSLESARRAGSRETSWAYLWFFRIQESLIRSRNVG